MEREEITGIRVLTNMIWRFAERFGAQTVSFIVTVILARILSPEVYGTVAIITVFTTVLFVFVDSGLGNALIQKKDADDVDFSSVFYLNIVICTVLYMFLFFVAPAISYFYKNTQMVLLIRVAGITLILSSIKNVQQAYVAKNMLFKKFFFATLGGTLLSGFVGIWMAYYGYGVWALVVSNLVNNTVDMIVLWVTVRWRPKRVFSMQRLRSLFAYGSKLLFTNIVNAIYANMYDLIIGKMYSSIDLAFYNKGRQLPELVVNDVDDAINSVLFPVLAEKQDSESEIKAMSKRALRTNFFIMTPLLFGMSAIAVPLISFLFTDKWISSAIYLQLFAIMVAFRPVSTVNLSAMKALGRSDLVFQLEILKDFSGIIILVFTISHGPLAIALGVFLNSFICMVINAWPSKAVFGYGIGEQFRDILPTIILGLFMGIAVYVIGMFGLKDYLTLLIQIPLGAIIYILGSKIFKFDTYYYSLDLVKQLLKKN